MAKERKQNLKKPAQEKKKIHWGKIFWNSLLVAIIILFIVNNTRKDDTPSFQYPPGTKKNLYEPDNPATYPLAYDFKLKSIDGSTKKNFLTIKVKLLFWISGQPGANPVSKEFQT